MQLIGRLKQESKDKENRVRRMAITLGGPRTSGTPTGLILELIHQSAGHVDWYGSRLQELLPDQLIKGTRGVTEEKRTGFQEGISVSKEAGPDVHLFLKLYNEERDRLWKMCSDATRLGLENKRIELEVSQGARVAEGFRWLQDRIMATMGVNDQAGLRSLFIEALKTLSSDSPFPQVERPKMLVAEPEFAPKRGRLADLK